MLTILEENASYQPKGKLVFSNFTGSGFLSFSYCQSRYSQLDFLVGKQKVVSLKKRSIGHRRFCEWKYATIPLNSTQQQVVVEGSSPYYVEVFIALDDFLFINQHGKVCDHISSPVNSTVNCSRGNHLGSVCLFRCTHGRPLIGSSARRCLPNGKWSGTEASCKTPQLRLQAVVDSISDTTSGNVQILVNGSWGQMCRGEWLQPEMASVACRSLGLGNQGDVVDLKQDGKLESAWTVIDKCNGSERNILDCERSGRSLCTARHVLHVICGQAYSSLRMSTSTRSTRVFS